MHAPTTAHQAPASSAYLRALLRQKRRESTRFALMLDGDRNLGQYRLLYESAERRIENISATLQARGVEFIAYRGFVLEVVPVSDDGRVHVYIERPDGAPVVAMLAAADGRVDVARERVDTYLAMQAREDGDV